MLNLVILDINLALNRCCLRLQNYSGHVLCYAVVFFEKFFCY